jgi:hypothetical protein
VQQLQEQLAQGQFDDMSCVDGFALSHSGEDRRPKLSFGRLVDGKLKHVVEIVEAYGNFLANSDILKLLIWAELGHLLTGRLLDFART